MKPVRSTFLTAEWRNLILANYTVDPSILIPYLPAKTELDYFDKDTYVSLVGFQFNNTKLRGIRIPFHQNFLEVNLRFYVRYKDGNYWKRGTVFISEIVPRRAITFVANTLYHEKYRTMKMKHHQYVKDGVLHLGYQWKLNKNWYNVQVEAAEIPLVMAVHTLEEFITEHYWGYSKQKDNLTIQYEVSHPRWLVQKVNKFEVEIDFAKLYGEIFGYLNNATPASVILTPGSTIAVYNKCILR